MAAEVLTRLAFANLAASLAILLVLLARRPVRAAFGAEVAYQLWLVPLAVGLALFVPGRSAEPGVDTASRLVLSAGQADLFGAVWVVGAIMLLALLVSSQARFMRRARAGMAGPAVVGFVAPRMVVPDDYESRFTEDERAVIRAHERAHIERRDPRANTVMAMIQCLCWFNPLVHLAIREAREDQELACDARVMGRLSREKALYARTLLKTQIGVKALPLGCHWPAAAPHPLEERVVMLARPLPSARRSFFGGALVSMMSLTVAVGAWSAQPEGPPQPKLEPVKWPVVVYAQIEMGVEREAPPR